MPLTHGTFCPLTGPEGVVAITPDPVAWLGPRGRFSA